MDNRVLLGIGVISEYLGVTPERVRAWIDENPDFPARREGLNGAWLTTSRALLNWLDGYVTRPRPAQARRPVRPPSRRMRAAHPSGRENVRQEYPPVRKA